MHGEDVARHSRVLHIDRGDASARFFGNGVALVIVDDPRQLGLGCKSDLPAGDQICFGRAVEERVENRLRDPHTYDWTRSGCRQIAGARRARYSAFTIIPDSCSGSSRTTVRSHPGIAFTLDRIPQFRL